MIPVNLAKARSLPVAAHGAMLRLHIGLEDPDDLIADLEQAFGQLRPSLKALNSHSPDSLRI